ncbi:hypothetical protein [Corynebacterium bovis]|uniref:Glycerol-3-phosphate acyltransferase PlsY n=1 Tax=Corynebacterium bovis DSM 20582 = CIP 54.80 TaxID=927655 RepID=A0A8H9Y7T0_9CORY|nr:hypothetical protein [Corynebacterium bovis]MBB3116612.1 glycerol-3-phosphate acyltransferase PlsY [Corynebacterium bovis DSM 20582 = CIP 54.80]QQC47170.1 hypothetical protein I6I09_09005 [Corynebacterium bovis]WJY76854.1 hypothetical protein CBOVI_01550 [Corynebacterium bovis DSM 20582 = CIP 54.80]
MAHNQTPGPYGEDGRTGGYPAGYQAGQGGYEARPGYDAAGYGHGYGDGAGAGYGQGYGPGYGTGYEGAGYDGAGAGSGLLAGSFDVRRVVVNLIVLAVLAAVVSFVVIFLVDLVISTVTGVPARGAGAAVITGAGTGLAGVVAGLLYIPVAGTGNENLFTVAVVALAVAAAVAWVLLGGLLDGNWRVLVTLAGIVCVAATAYAAPTRIESARVR